jgi:hypothetical protein
MIVMQFSLAPERTFQQRVDRQSGGQQW